jgi:hypothetical protein
MVTIQLTDKEAERLGKLLKWRIEQLDKFRQPVTNSAYGILDFSSMYKEREAHRKSMLRVLKVYDSMFPKVMKAIAKNQRGATNG